MSHAGPAGPARAPDLSADAPHPLGRPAHSVDPTLTPPPPPRLILPTPLLKPLWDRPSPLLSHCKCLALNLA